MTRCAFSQALPRAVRRLLPLILLVGGVFGPGARADTFDELREKWLVTLTSTWLTNTLDPAALVTGTNVLAIEVHQNAVTSSDLAMNFELTGQVRVTSAPRLAMSASGGQWTLRWPAEDAWFSPGYATNLTPPVTWLPLTNSAVWVNGEWLIPVPSATNGQRFWRLQTR